MNNLIFDSSALAAYLTDGPGAGDVSEWLLRLVGETELQGWMSTTAVGELYHMVMRRKNEQTAERALRALTSLPIQMIEPDLELAVEAAKLKATHAISYVDALTAALAIREQGLLIAADPVFEELRGIPHFSVQYL